MNSKDFAKSIAQFALEGKAQDLAVLEVKKISGITDYFVIASATSDRQARSICDKIIESVRQKHQIRPSFIEGTEEARWIVIDFFDVIVHVFQAEARQEYDLEGFWKEAPRVRFRLGLKAPTLKTKKTGKQKPSS